ncbi:hypothetical protein C5O80_28465 [Burkholderia sp. SRS-46]|nr:hypothetical protein C5O80_28465 [Burkholderia sp. SRS-46]
MAWGVTRLRLGRSEISDRNEETAALLTPHFRRYGFTLACAVFEVIAQAGHVTASTPRSCAWQI